MWRCNTFFPLQKKPWMHRSTNSTYPHHDAVTSLSGVLQSFRNAAGSFCKEFCKTELKCLQQSKRNTAELIQLKRFQFKRFTLLEIQQHWCEWSPRSHRPPAAWWPENREREICLTFLYSVGADGFRFAVAVVLIKSSDVCCEHLPPPFWRWVACSQGWVWCSGCSVELWCGGSSSGFPESSMIRYEHHQPHTGHEPCL